MSNMHTPTMREDRPLEALMPELTTMEPASNQDRAVPGVHQRVLEVSLETHSEWALAIWRDDGPVAVRRDLSSLIHVTFLSTLSRPPGHPNVRQAFEGVRVLAFDHLTEETQEVLTRMGFRECAFNVDEDSARMSALSKEASEFGWSIPHAPLSVWYAPLEVPDPALAAKYIAIEDGLVEALKPLVWGERPGLPSKVLADLVTHHFNTKIELSIESLQMLDVLLIDHTPHKLRWLPPMIFQAICDYLAVLAQRVYDAEMQWGVCEVERDGLAPPPLLRATRPDGYKSIPLGIRLVKWCLMPMDEAEADDLLPERFVSLFQDV